MISSSDEQKDPPASREISLRRGVLTETGKFRDEVDDAAFNCECNAAFTAELRSALASVTEGLGELDRGVPLLRAALL